MSAPRFASVPVIVAAFSFAWFAAGHARALPGGSPGGLRAAAAADTISYVVHVSVDGLRADAVSRLGAYAAPNLWRMRIEGAFTENARTDYDFTTTLPNHTCQLTGRPVLGAGGHGVIFNNDDPRTLAEVHGSYVAGVFDVAHDHGLRTACFAGKTKFEIFNRSWNDVNGAPDTTGLDNGRDKIDLYLYSGDSAVLLTTFIDAMEETPFPYAFIHFADPDAAGHSYGWESKRYFDAVMRVDGYVGRLLDLLESDPRFIGRSRLVVAVDHGGEETDHSAVSKPANYTIPLYVWGAGIGAGADLYALNPESRLDPEGERPPYGIAPQPIRNGEAGNLCLAWLGLPAIPGSSIGSSQDCALAPANGIPAVSIASPADGAAVEYPEDVVIEASADGGAAGIARVEFYGDGAFLADDATSPYEHVWTAPPLGSHRIFARAVSGAGAAAGASVEMSVVSATPAPAEHSSLPAPPLLYPNPASGSSTISFAIARNADVTLDLFDIGGRRIERMWSGRLGEGRHSIAMDTRSRAPGLYFFRLSAGRETRGGKLTIVR